MNHIRQFSKFLFNLRQSSSSEPSLQSSFPSQCKLLTMHCCLFLQLNFVDEQERKSKKNIENFEKLKFKVCYCCLIYSNVHNTDYKIEATTHKRESADHDNINYRSLHKLEKIIQKLMRTKEKNILQSVSSLLSTQSNSPSHFQILRMQPPSLHCQCCDVQVVAGSSVTFLQSFSSVPSSQSTLPSQSHTFGKHLPSQVNSPAVHVCSSNKTLKEIR